MWENAGGGGPSLPTGHCPMCEPKKRAGAGRAELISQLRGTGPSLSLTSHTFPP